MKKLFTIVIMVLLAINVFGQAKKPSIMVMPSARWCNTNGYLDIVDNMGVETYIPNYQKALVTDPNLTNVIAQINGLMSDRGFPLESLEQTMNSINRQNAELAVVTTKDGSGAVKTNDLMAIRQQARADIIMEVTWSINTMGPKRSITYTLEAFDSYTSKSVASSTGTGSPSFTAEIPVLLSEAVNSHIDEFCDRLQSHFDDLFENGREVSLNINIFENDEDIDLETVYGDKELREIIEDWVYDQTVSHRYNLSDDSELYMNFDEVRIPLYDERGRAIAANRFAQSLVRYLKAEPYNIEKIKLMNQGLGQCTIIIGNK